MMTYLDSVSSATTFSVGGLNSRSVKVVEESLDDLIILL